MDLLRESALGGKGTFNPPTYREAVPMEDGKGYMLEEPVLNVYRDFWLNESLDYIFEIQM